MADFSLLRLFVVICHLGNFIQQVDWGPLACGWTKYNTDRASKGFPRHAGSGGIFKHSSAAVLGYFASYYVIVPPLHAELLAAMNAIEKAWNIGWFNLWLECDSIVVVSAFTSPDLVP